MPLDTDLTPPDLDRLTETVDRAIMNEGDPLRLVAHYRELNTEKKALEARLDALKPAVDKLVGEGEKSAAYGVQIDGKPYEYVVTRVRQDRRVLNDVLLGAWLHRKGLDAAVEMKPFPVAEKVAELVKNGKVGKKDLEACMTGNIVKYPTVTLREVKADAE